MSDDIPQARRADAEAADGQTAEVPAGGRGADSGAVSSTRIDDTDRAPVQNISSQNDIAGVGTRAADGSIEHSDVGDVASKRRTYEPTRPGTSDSAEPAPSLAQQYEPGVDPAHARDSRVAGPAASDGDPGSAGDRTDDRADRVAQKTGSWAGVAIGGFVGVVAIVLFAFAVPQAPAVAWIGIALEVALLAALGVSAGMLRPGRYRRLSITILVAVMLVVAVLFGVLLLVLTLAG